MKRGVYSLILLVLVLGLTSYMDLGFNIKDITGLVIQENNQIPIEQNNNPILTFFCPRDHCADQLIYLIKKSNKIDCAFFELDHPDIISALSKKDHRLVIDGNYKEEVPTTFNAKFDTTKQFSHNKFCIFDNKIVWTGSMNPTVNGDEKNNNNVVVVESTVLAQNYNKEFEQLWSGVFGATKEAQDIQHELVVNNITLENYFCPEDNCADEIVSELQKAQQSIVFMTFAFTHKDILATFLERQQQGVKIAGVFEN